MESYNPASYRGGILACTTPAPRSWGRGSISWPPGARGVVPFGLQPGAAAVTLGAGEEREVERIPAQLRRFL